MGDTGFGEWGHGGCERRSEVIVKIQKKKKIGRRRGSGQSGCERRIEVIVRIKKKKSGGKGGGGGDGEGRITKI